MTEMSGDDGLREAIALAIYASDFGDIDDWDKERDTFQGEYRANADAVLALLKVATLRAKAAAADRVREALDTLSRETGAYEAGYKGWAQQVIRNVRAALDGSDREGRGRC